MNIPRSIFRLLLGRRPPITSGSVNVAGIERPVVVRRDGHGIPYIEAEGEADAWYGLGFCQGQDRAFQLEMVLRVSRGTLAELLGHEALPADRLSRHIGFLHSARLQWDALDSDIRGILEAFARGVSEGATLGCSRAAHEFTLLRTKPTPWTGVDVVALAKLQSFALAANWDIELARLRILREDGPEAVSSLDPAYPEWLPVSAPPGAPAGAAIDRLSEDLNALREVVGHTGGSNGWALGPNRTRTGRAILASDAHLRPALPPHWYLAHVRTPEWAVAGASFVGLPTLSVGFNGSAAWGITAGLADNTDLFIEELGPDGRSVRQGDGFAACDVRRETIRVKGSDDVVEEVIETPRGPIIGPALDSDSEAVSLRATWLDPRPIEGFLRVPRCRTFEEFRRTFEKWPLMSLNVQYADASGRIGWQLVGDVPRRRSGWGAIPQPGWQPEVGWEDSPIPFDEMPYVADPESGIVATANNRPTREGEGPFLGADWIDGYRAARIFEALEARRDWDLRSSLSLQMDQTSLPWRELRDVVVATPVQSPEAIEAQALLEQWDGVVSADSVGASVFELFVAELFARFVQIKAPRSSQWALGKGFNVVLPYTFLIARRAGLLARLFKDKPGRASKPQSSQAVEDALAAAVTSLRDRYGDDQRKWAWGRIRTLTLRHPVGRKRVLSRVFNRGPFPWGGDENTLSQAAPDPADPTSNPLATASLRMAVDVGNWEENRFCLPGGQSGNPLSPHYDDMLDLWKLGDGVPIAWSQSAVKKVSVASVRLLPDTHPATP